MVQASRELMPAIETRLYIGNSRQLGPVVVSTPMNSSLHAVSISSLFRRLQNNDTFRGMSIFQYRMGRQLGDLIIFLQPKMGNFFWKFATGDGQTIAEATIQSRTAYADRKARLELSKKTSVESWKAICETGSTPSILPRQEAIISMQYRSCSGWWTDASLLDNTYIILFIQSYD